jgi:hypothetical protein
MNTNLLRTLLIAAVASTATAADIPAGTHLLLRMEHSISSNRAQVGDGVHLRTVTPLSAGGRVVVPIGSYAQGVVTQVKRSGRGHGQAGLQIQLVTLMLPSGEVLNISTRTSGLEPEEGTPGAPRRAGARPGGAMLGATLAGAVFGGLTGARIGMGVGIAAMVIPALVARGREVELRQGTAVDVVFDQPATIEVRS